MAALAQTEDLPAFRHGLITQGRDTGNAWYIVLREYPSNLELTMLKLDHTESLRRGGGAKRKNTRKSEMDEGTLAKAQQRARSNVRRRCFSTDMDTMLTLTFRENVTDIQEAWAVFKYFSRLMRWRFKERWFYVCVPEYQKRGAVHFHLAIKGFFPVGTVRRLWRRACGTREGNIDIRSPRSIGKNSWNPRRIAQYLSKYISKNDSVEFNKRRYASGGEFPPPLIVRGWTAWGLYMPKLAREIFKEFTHKQIGVMWESEEMRPILYCST